MESPTAQSAWFRLRDRIILCTMHSSYRAQIRHAGSRSHELCVEVMVTASSCRISSTIELSTVAGRPTDSHLAVMLTLEIWVFRDLCGSG